MTYECVCASCSGTRNEGGCRAYSIQQQYPRVQKETKVHAEKLSPNQTHTLVQQ